MTKSTPMPVVDVVLVADAGVDDSAVHDERSIVEEIDPRVSLFQAAPCRRCRPAATVAEPDVAIVGKLALDNERAARLALEEVDANAIALADACIRRIAVDVKGRLLDADRSRGEIRQGAKLDKRRLIVLGVADADIAAIDQLAADGQFAAGRAVRDVEADAVVVAHAGALRPGFLSPPSRRW